MCAEVGTLLPYYFVYMVLIGFGIWSIHVPAVRKEKTVKRYFVLWFLIWFLLLGLRHPSMGIDLQYGSREGYLGRFRDISGLDWEYLFRLEIGYEPGYLLFNKLVGLLGGDYQLLLISCALVSVGLSAIWLYRNCGDLPVLTSVIFMGLPVFLANYSALRQSIAIPITFFAYEMIKKRKPVRFGLLVLLAASFHRSALLFFVAYPLFRVRITKTGRLLTLLFPPVVYALRVPLFRLLSVLLKQDAKMDYNGAATLFLVLFLVYVFCTLFGHYDDREEQGLCTMLLLTCLCQAFGGLYNTAMRVGWYFMPYITLLLPRIIENTEAERQHEMQKNGLIMYLVILVCFAVFGLHSLSRGSWAMSNPYYFFWQKI